MTSSSSSPAKADRDAHQPVPGRRGRLPSLMPFVLVVALVGSVGLLACGGDEGDQDQEEVEEDGDKRLGALPGNPKGQLVADIYGWLSSAYSYLTDRRTCSALIENFTQDTFTWVGDEAKSEDSWVNNPTRTIPPWDRVWYHDGGLAFWTTKGGWMRGCWNIVNYKSPRGTVRVGLSDPWTGSNNYECVVTGVDGKPAPWRCVRNWIHQSVLSGNHLLATYCLVEDGAGDQACKE